MNDNGYYWVRLKDDLYYNNAIAIFKRNYNGRLKTSYVYRIYLKPLIGYEAYDISFYGSICNDDEISEIRPCNENEIALLHYYLTKKGGFNEFQWC